MAVTQTQPVITCHTHKAVSSPIRPAAGVLHGQGRLRVRCPLDKAWWPCRYPDEGASFPPGSACKELRKFIQTLL